MKLALHYIIEVTISNSSICIFDIVKWHGFGITIHHGGTLVTIGLKPGNFLVLHCSNNSLIVVRRGMCFLEGLQRNLGSAARVNTFIENCIHIIRLVKVLLVGMVTT